MTVPTTVVSYATALVARDVTTIEAALLDAMATDGVDIAGFGDFSVQRAMPRLQATAQASLESLRVQLVQAGTATTAYLAGDDWVDVTLGGFFFEARIQAMKTQVALTVTAGTSPASAKSREWVAQGNDGTLYDNVDPINLAAGASKPITFQCRTAGIIGNAPTGTITDLVVGAAGVTITNPSGSLVLAGRDQETSADYLIRCVGKWGVLGRGGNALAYYYLIPQAAPTITRILIREDNPFGPGSIGICLANAAGPATTTEITLVANLLIPIKPLGSGLLKVFAAAPQTVTVRATLYGDGSNDAALVALGESTLNQLQSTYPIGSLKNLALYRAKLFEVLMQIPGMLNAAISSPSADVALAPYAVIEITPNLSLAP